MKNWFLKAGKLTQTRLHLLCSRLVQFMMQCAIFLVHTPMLGDSIVLPEIAKPDFLLPFLQELLETTDWFRDPLLADCLKNPLLRLCTRYVVCLGNLDYLDRICFLIRSNTFTNRPSLNTVPTICTATGFRNHIFFIFAIASRKQAQRKVLESNHYRWNFS